MADGIFEFMKLISVIVLSMFCVIYYSLNVNPESFDFMLIIVLPFFVGYGSANFFTNLILGDYNE